MRSIVLLMLALAGAPCVLQAQGVRTRGSLRPLGVGVPFAGAAVSAPALGLAVCANAAGRFALTLPPDQDVELRIQPVGFDPYDLTVRVGPDSLSLPVGEHLIELDGLTVVALSAAGRGAAAWAVTELQGGDLARTPGGIAEALQGRVAGVARQSGAPGGSFRIDLRGVRSLLAGTEPIVVLDGAVVSSVRIPSGIGSVTGAREEDQDLLSRLADISPSDIERIEVIRGAAASARFGPRAGNGVIAITTRRGVIEPTEVDPSLALRCFQPAR